MENSIGQLDKLIEQKVDNKIKEFSKSLTDQITKFLKDNGYEVTRENMANPELSVKQPSEG